MDFRNKRVWLTGASSGIGEALVAPLVARGARVAITARRHDRLDAIAARHRSDAQPAVMPFPADVTSRTSVLETARAIEFAWGGIDVAIFNAGGHQRLADDAFRADAYIDTMVLNYFSVVFGLEAVVDGMRTRGSGHVAAVASLAGYRGLPTAAAYGASKAAVIHLLDAIRFDLEPQGIGVTVINPGFVKTPLTDRNRFPMPFLISAEDAARRIVNGLERDRNEIHFPAPFSWALKLMRVLPFPAYEFVMKRWALRAGHTRRRDAQDDQLGTGGTRRSD
jgi:short-subunit dehydrogenase